VQGHRAHLQLPGAGRAGPPNREYVCSGDIYCAGGACQQIERQSSNEFKDALVALGAIDQAHKEFDPDKLEMFSGTRETCHKPVFGLVNCCAGKVSGLLTGARRSRPIRRSPPGGATAIASVATQFLTTFLCASSRKQLDVKDRLGLCHFVGSYCSSSFLGVCTKRKTYCCFESKLTRIIQEQGRPQIDKPWGPPKTEQCVGLTLDEFSASISRRWTSRKSSEFLESAKLPDQAQMASDIQAKIKAYYQQNATSGSATNGNGGN
jgi:conjugal transfer mating pair stabilization protein TraN